MEERDLRISGLFRSLIFLGPRCEACPGNVHNVHNVHGKSGSGVAPVGTVSTVPGVIPYRS
jgi:hypothetical protein